MADTDLGSAAKTPTVDPESYFSGVDVASSATARTLNFCRSEFESPVFLLPGAGEVPSRPPRGFAAVHAESLRCGLRLPFQPFVQELLSTVNLHAAQLTPNSYRFMTACHAMWFSASGGLRMTVGDFLDMFSLLPASVSPGSYFFRERRSSKVLDRLNTKDCDWKSEWVWVEEGLFGNAPREFSRPVDLPRGFGSKKKTPSLFVSTILGFPLADRDAALFLDRDLWRRVGWFPYADANKEDVLASWPSNQNLKSVSLFPYGLPCDSSTDLTRSKISRKRRKKSHPKNAIMDEPRTRDFVSSCVLQVVERFTPGELAELNHAPSDTLASTLTEDLMQALLRAVETRESLRVAEERLREKSQENRKIREELKVAKDRVEKLEEVMVNERECSRRKCEGLREEISRREKAMCRLREEKSRANEALRAQNDRVLKELADLKASLNKEGPIGNLISSLDSNVKGVDMPVWVEPKMET